MLFIDIKTYLTSFFASRYNTFDGPKLMGRDPYGPTSMKNNTQSQSFTVGPTSMVRSQSGPTSTGSTRVP